MAVVVVIVGILSVGRGSEPPKQPTPEDIEFFENRIRPVLVEHCYECHNHVDTSEAELAVDSRDGIRQATEHGVAVVPGQPEKSLLLRVIRHEIEGLEMPDGGARLDDQVIADFETWIRMGAPDPRDRPPSAEQLAEATSWSAILQKRKQWWSFQPIVRASVPDVDNEWSAHPIDQFILAKLRSHELKPSGLADRRTLIRRLTFALTGLPPTPRQVDQFVTDDDPKAVEHLIDRLLASPQFGERWARHWMDLVRYADSHGSEGDPNIPHAYRYRDYLIRALNADVPYDQLLREHVAGDLLEQPRVNHELGINESAIGAAHWRLVFHGFAPTDALDEKVRFTDDQINVFSKAFLGLTISCARCHDHKFDAISQKDYYALFGILASCRPALLDVNTPERQRLHQQPLREIKHQIRKAVANDWIATNQVTAEKLIDLEDPGKHKTDESKLTGVMGIWHQVQQALGESKNFAEVWRVQRRQMDQAIADRDKDRHRVADWRWNLAETEDFRRWFAFGNGLTLQPSAPGEFTIALEGDRIVDRIFPAGVYTHGLSTRHRGFLASPRILLQEDYQVWLRVTGGGKATVRYAVQNYPRSGTVYPIREITRDDWHWQPLDLKYWRGDHVHFELATARDAPLQVRNEDRSWFGIREVVIRKAGQPAPVDNEADLFEPLLGAMGDNSPNTLAELANYFSQAVTDAAIAWRDGTLTDSQAVFLDACLRDGLLPNALETHPEWRAAVEEYRRLEAEIPLPTRVPGLVEADAFDQQLFERGNHRRPLAPVRRRFLEAIDETAYETDHSGRLELADDLLRNDNPLTARVIVNRIWHYLFGQGIVATPDNLGRLGSRPSHPLLLDYLASHHVENGWSMKQTIRFMLTSKTWQLSSKASEKATEIDPENRWLSHASVRRLDAEAIRDSLFAVTGQLDRKMFGPGFGANGDTPRRSVYVMSRRNSLDQFLQVFDSPLPFATKGRRDVTNVPAQSLTMLNDPLVMQLAERWIDKLVKQRPNDTREQRIALMYRTALSREPTADERQAVLEYLNQTCDAFKQQTKSESVGRDAWARFAHVLLNLKEFIYIR